MPRSAVARNAVIFEAAYARKGHAVRSNKVVGGIDMLVYQAIKGFEILCGSKIRDYRKAKAEIRKRLSV